MADYNRAYSEPPRFPQILPNWTSPPAIRPIVPEAPSRPSPGPSIPSWIHQPTAPPPAFPGLPRSSGGPTFSQDSETAGAGIGAEARAGGYSPFTPSPPVQHYATGPTLDADIGEFKMTSLDPASTIAKPESHSSIPKDQYDNHTEREKCPSCLGISTYPVTNDGGSIMGCTECLKTFSSPESLLKS